MLRSSSAHRPATDADFGAQVLAHLQPLYALALRLTRSRSDAEDLVQDTLVKALRAAHRYQQGTNLKAWLFTILHNTWRNARRDAARDAVDVDSDRVDQAAQDAGPATDDTPEALLLRATLAADVQAALDGLPEAYREAVWLRDVEELTYAEIASMLDIPVGTVMSRLSRGRRLLVERLRSTGDSAAAGMPVAELAAVARPPRTERHE